MSEIEDLKSLIRHRERRIERHTQVLKHLKAALDEAESQEGEADSQKRPKKTGLTPFTKKYDRTSAEYVTELLSRHPGFGLTQRAIMDKLAAEGRIYSFQSVRHTLKQLIKSGTLIQSTAPEAESARFVYKIAQSAANASG